MTKKAKEMPVLSRGVSIIDSHCHLDMEAYQDDLIPLIERAKQHQVEQILTIGIDIASSRAAIALAREHEAVSATIGIHPHDIDAVTSETYDTLGQLADSHKEHIVGYGEIGLDYVKNYSDPEKQRLHFANQLSLARTLKLPIIIHDREAHEDTLRIIKDSGTLEYGGVMHCFSGDMKLATEVLDLGLYISIPGVVTFKNAVTMQDVARTIPLESLLLETDGPFLAPHPYRGKRNEPAYTLYIAACIAELREMDLDDLALATTANTRTLFGL